MELNGLPTITRLALGLVVLSLGYYVVQLIILNRKRNAFAREKGALPAKRWPQREYILGYDMFKENIRNLKDHNLLENTIKRFEKMGVNTYQLVALGRTVHITTEPENLKMIQAVDHKNWSLGKRRKVGFRPLLGDGIFTTDGAAWAHSRYLFRQPV
jgi:hypothetical protein